jgi:putative hydrolase of the HAD superfamily
VVSDCSAETPEVWVDSPVARYVETTSFSCETGLRKPDPEAYLVAVRALGVDAGACVFVGDGGSHELTGASALGMTAFRYAPHQGQTGDVLDRDPDWTGPTLTDLIDLGGGLLA